MSNREFETAVALYVANLQIFLVSKDDSIANIKHSNTSSESAKEKNPDNSAFTEQKNLKETYSTFTADGPAPYQGDILEDPNLLWTEDVWTSEKESKALETILKQGSTVSQYWKDHYVTKAGNYWHEFYKRNQDHFYKDRHYIHIVFPELAPSSSSSADGTLPASNDSPVCSSSSTSSSSDSSISTDSLVTLLEIGCGVGNAVLPLLDINPALSITAIDFAKSAITIFNNTISSLEPSSKRERIRAFENNIVKDVLPVENESTNYVLCMFVISAIQRNEHLQIFQKIYNCMKPGGKLFFRDYGRYDEAQLRFKKGSKLDDSFYVRQDGTCSYFFTIEELGDMMKKVGFEIEELEYIYRQYANRQQRKARYRVWIHGKFVKKG
jgi:methyltransferase-like protein 6